MDDAQQIASASEKASRKLMVGYILRLDPSYAHIEEAIYAGDISELPYAHARRIGLMNLIKRLGKRVAVNDYMAVDDIDQVSWHH